MKFNIEEKVLALKDETIKTRRTIHKNPELGFEEFEHLI